MSIPGFESVEEALKVRYRPLFTALQRALRSWPGGATDAFRVLDWSPQMALNQCNPAVYDAAPSLYRFLRLVEYMRPREVVHEIASLADCLTVPAPSVRKAEPTNQAAADALGAALRKVIYELEPMAGRPSVAQAADYRADLLKLMDAAQVMLMRLPRI